jgi:phospholipid transport system transporter-binding protein
MSKPARKPVKPAKPAKQIKPTRSAAQVSPVLPVASPVSPVLSAVVSPVTSAVLTTPAPEVSIAALPTPENGGARAGLRLEVSCLLRDSLDFQFHLLSADFGSGEVLVDGSAVERVDTAGLQLLLAFVQHQATQGRKVSWTSASDALDRAAARLGLAASLHLPGAAGCAA